MVTLQSNQTNIIIKRDFRDYIDIITSLLAIIISLIILLVYYSIKFGNLSIELLFLTSIFILVIFYFVFPNSITEIILKQDLWKSQKRYLFFNFRKIHGKITDIESFISNEQLFDKSKNTKRNSFRLYYEISLDIYEIIKNTTSNEKKPLNQDYTENLITLFSRKTYSKTVFTKEMNKIRMIGKGISDFFIKLEIPIGFNIKREYIKEDKKN